MYLRRSRKVEPRSRFSEEKARRLASPIVHLPLSGKKNREAASPKSGPKDFAGLDRGQGAILGRATPPGASPPARAAEPFSFVLRKLAGSRRNPLSHAELPARVARGKILAAVSAHQRAPRDVKVLLPTFLSRKVGATQKFFCRLFFQEKSPAVRRRSPYVGLRKAEAGLPHQPGFRRGGKVSQTHRRSSRSERPT